jgi:phenolic acid decarboxylase
MVTGVWVKSQTDSVADMAEVAATLVIIGNTEIFAEIAMCGNGILIVGAAFHAKWF